MGTGTRTESTSAAVRHPGGADERLARVLSNLRMRSTFYSHAELGDPWSLEMPAIPDSLSFHVLIAGTCWLRLPGAGSTRPSLVELAAGDLALVPHGAGHDLLSDPDSPRGPRVDLLPQDYLSE
ncbi:cupin domain-containing protein, partial [Burkholderia multivorans]|uniref:cupin domain-containing protein n=1 Tax=Burkholderia multivorans TaxID=87883 RepID=UPI000DB4DFBE